VVLTAATRVAWSSQETRATMSGKSGTLSGRLSLSAAWAHRINQLLGKRMVKPGTDLGDLTSTLTVA
jgi:hypothetical protein